MFVCLCIYAFVNIYFRTCLRSFVCVCVHMLISVRIDGTPSV